MLIQPCEKCSTPSTTLKEVVTAEGTTVNVCPVCAMAIVNEKTTTESQLLKG